MFILCYFFFVSIQPFRVLFSVSFSPPLPVSVPHFRFSLVTICMVSCVAADGLTLRVYLACRYENSSNNNQCTTQWHSHKHKQTIITLIIASARAYIISPLCSTDLMMMSTPLLLLLSYRMECFGSADDQLMPISFSFAQNVEISSICAQ